MPRWPFRSTRHAPDTGTPHADPATQLAAAVASLDEPWRSSLQLSFDQLAEADPLYAPTEFWQPGVRSLVADLGSRGLEQFKSWPSAAFFFYPRYSPTLSYALRPARCLAGKGDPRHPYRLIGVYGARRVRGQLGRLEPATPPTGLHDGTPAEVYDAAAA